MRDDVVPRVSVIVPTLGRFEPLLQTVGDLMAQNHDDFEVIVVDQNRSWPSELKSSVEALKSTPSVRWFTVTPEGVVKARNFAVSQARGSILVFVDDDVLIPEPSFLTRHERRFDDDRLSAVAGRECPADQSGAPLYSDEPPLPHPGDWSPLQQAMWFDRNRPRAQFVTTFSTCNGAIRRSAFDAVGGFDERFGGSSYGDDYDLALRLAAAGHQILFDPAPWLVHRRVPAGGLRLSDRSNRVQWLATATGFWVFVLRHGHRGMFGHLLLRHVLRKTVLLKSNLMRPWRLPMVMLQTLAALPVAAFKIATAQPQQARGDVRL